MYAIRSYYDQRRVEAHDADPTLEQLARRIFQVVFQQRGHRIDDIHPRAHPPVDEQAQREQDAGA